MSQLSEIDTDALIQRAGQGDRSAVSELLGRHRHRLKQMIHARMDRRLSSRMDSSDLVQEVLVEAAQKLPKYARQPPLPFYPWIRELAWERLVHTYRRHVLAEKRTVTREAGGDLMLSDESTSQLAVNVLRGDSAPSGRLLRSEMRRRLQQALLRLKPIDRELLVLRYVEQLSTSEISAVLEISVPAIKMRHLRSLRKLRELLSDPSDEVRP